MLFHILLDGAAGPDVHLDEDPVPEQHIDLGDGLVIRVCAVDVRDDGTRVIAAFVNTHETAGYSQTRRDLLNEREARVMLGGISRPTLSRIRQRREIAEVRIGRRSLTR